MTFCIIARDKATGLLGLAQATNPLSVGGRCPFIRANVGAVSTQAYTDPGLGPLAIELLTLGHSPQKVIKELGESDPHFEWRQIGIVDRHGRAAVHTGKQCKVHSGAIVGDGYLVMGNYLLTDQVVPKMDEAWRNSEGKLFEERLLAAAVAARDAGGDLGGHRSSCMLVYDTEAYARTDLRIDFVPKREGERDAVDALGEILDRWKPMIGYYKVRPHNPSMPGWSDWLAEQGTPFRD
ncbi:DUF1028 domain-containing protein [Ramlibacter albus]|uniref:DUF1028 domain-containing protein n=1 Tax=Ramlibacter albus TaxID=2079448 RepID=A0A923S429_9BURK|nr:DUF1028 domain-containing protein [Ramlibacter albus]MBC5767046.1 DUF1028 domain-containing protein [Ramlibacter albus]